jgi:hypothetical protein
LVSATFERALGHVDVVLRANLKIVELFGPDVEPLAALRISLVR